MILFMPIYSVGFAQKNDNSKTALSQWVRSMSNYFDKFDFEHLDSVFKIYNNPLKRNYTTESDINAKNMITKYKKRELYDPYDTSVHNNKVIGRKDGDYYTIDQNYDIVKRFPKKVKIRVATNTSADIFINGNCVKSNDTLYLSESISRSSLKFEASAKAIGYKPGYQQFMTEPFQDEEDSGFLTVSLTLIPEKFPWYVDSAEKIINERYKDYISLSRHRGYEVRMNVDVRHNGEYFRECSTKVISPGRPGMNDYSIITFDGCIDYDVLTKKEVLHGVTGASSIPVPPNYFFDNAGNASNYTLLR